MSMYALFEESGKFLAGRVLSSTDASMQIELDSGKRVKIKVANVLAQFDQPQPQVLFTQSQAIAQSIDPAMAWEFAPDEEFAFNALAFDYFSNKAPIVEQIGMLFCLFEHPHYFRRCGKGRFKPAPKEVVEQALLAIEKKNQIQTSIEQWAQDLVNQTCPPAILSQLYKILFKPDKNAPEYKAVVQAAQSSRTPPLLLLKNAGAMASPYQFHWQRFVFDCFPKGLAFPVCSAPMHTEVLPMAQDIYAFSIDDSSTTEIDDALSVCGLGTAVVTVGIHIAAPALAFAPNEALDKIARQRLSTVYMPGKKVTMLPENVIEQYTLQEGKSCPAVSLYVQFNAETLDILDTTTRVENVFIAHNLRHDVLDAWVSDQWLTQSNNADEQEYSGSTAHISIHPKGIPVPDVLAKHHEKLSFLYRLALDLKRKREIVRGKPEVFNRPDYSFSLMNSQDGEPTGDELVKISIRKRGEPLDLLVAETMILANSTWGQWMADCGVPGIYRSQYSMAPGVKVKMGSRALPHAGMGVSCYAWSTSPLRRYTDMVNQWQLIACIKHGKMAPLSAPFKPKDAELFGIISQFENTHASYRDVQNNMERFWTLKYIEQNRHTNGAELTVTLFKDNLARADDLPLVLSVLGMGQTALPRGAQLRVKLGKIDFITLDVQGEFLEHLNPSLQNELDADAETEEDTGDEQQAIGVLQIAVTIDDEESQPQLPTVAV